MRAQRKGHVRKGSVLRVEFPSPEAMGSFAAELNAACAVSNAATPYGAPLSWTPEGGIVLPERVTAAAAAPAKPISLASRSTPVILSYRLKHVALTQCAESPLDASLCSAATLRGLPPRVLASADKAVGEQPLVELVRGRCAGEKDGGGLPYVAPPGLSSLRESCHVRLKFGVVDLAPPAKGAKGASLPSSPRLPATLAAEAAFAVSFFAALQAAPAVQGSDPNHPAKRLSDVVAQLAAVGVTAQPLTPVFADASFVLVCAHKDCGLGDAAAKAAGIAPRVRYGLKLSALTPHGGLQAHAVLKARSTVLLGRRRSDSELTSRVVGFLSRPAKTAPARPGKPLLPPAAFARDAAVPDLHAVARSRALQAGLVHLAATVSLWLAATAQVPPASRGGDLLAVDRACHSDAGGVFGRCGAATSPRLLNKWGTLLAARPRAVFGAASMPRAARPGGALGLALSASNAALRRVARAFVRHLVSPRVRADAFPGLSDAHVEAVVAAALLATFSADSPAVAWRPVPRPLPLVTIGGEPAFFVEDRRPSHSLALGPQGFVPVPVSGPRFAAPEGAGMRVAEADAASADADAFLELEDGSGEDAEAEAWASEDAEAEAGEDAEAWGGDGNGAEAEAGSGAEALADTDAEIAAWSCLSAREGEEAADPPANATEHAPPVPRSQPGLLIAGSRAVLQSLDELRGMNELEDAASRRARALAALPICRAPRDGEKGSRSKAKKRLREKSQAAAENTTTANATAANATAGL